LRQKFIPISILNFSPGSENPNSVNQTKIAARKAPLAPKLSLPVQQLLQQKA